MNNDIHQIFESYVDGITQKKRELTGNIMDIIRYGLPKEEEIPGLKNRLIEIFKNIKAHGNKPTEQEVIEAKQIMGQLRASGMNKAELVSMYKQSDNEAKPEGEEMPYPEFAKLSKHVSPKSSKEKEETDPEIHDLAKSDSREEHENKNEDEESGLPSLYQFHKMLQAHDWEYQYSDDGSVYRRGAQQERDIARAIEKGGKSYEDLYKEYRKNIGNKEFKGPEKTRDEIDQDADLLRAMAARMKEVSQHLIHDIDANSITHPQQLWDLYYPAYYILSQIKDIAEAKNFKHVLNSINKHNI
ncbi:MAG: hypothetical protein EBU90_18970 [Proteobacteria bacterium]|nr:hypothetical protein [Pseudomonadota bacterium]NBP15497.1 hypothetical protein [bacterium]